MTSSGGLLRLLVVVGDIIMNGWETVGSSLTTAAACSSAQ